MAAELPSALTRWRLPGPSIQGLASVREASRWRVVSVARLSTDSANAESRSVSAQNLLQEGDEMPDYLGDHKGRESGRTTSNLAVEIKRIIRELDADHYPEEEPSQAERHRYDDEMQDESPEPSATHYSLTRNLEDATVESVIAIRLLHELVQLRHSELLEQIAQMEQNLQDEISLMERRVRGDIAMLRTERRGIADSDFEQRVEDDLGSQKRDFGR